MAYFFSFLLLAAQPAGGESDILQSIDRTRGGRHWVDAKTQPPKSPKESQACFQIEPGARIELVAAEPLVFDPVAIAFDERGRMFVAEYTDYPTGAPEGEKPLSKIVMLDDTDGDGTLNRHVFAEGLNFCHNLMPYREGILVGAQTELIYLRDTDGDHRADVREVLFSGFTPAHPQMQIGNPRWGFDNWIYCNYAPGEITSKAAPDKKVTLPRLDFRFHPRTLEFEPDSGMGQYGNTIDNWGHRFYTTNRNPIIMSMLPRAAVERNPFAVISKPATDVGPSGGDTRVYPLVAMKSNWLAHAGTHTSACGATAYRGDLFGGDYPHSVFVCEPVGHVVTRSIVKPHGATLTAVRARPDADFLASSDEWFRPASLATGPDGALYLADMYRLWVEHPKFLPDDIAAKLDWRAGEDRGRIWRILPEKTTPRKFTPPQSTDDLVRLLEDTNGWRRHLGQRLLVERQATAAVPALVRLLNSSKSPAARLHALWTLDGLEQLAVAHVLTALADTDEFVRRDAVKLAAHFLDDKDVQQQFVKLAGDSDVRVRFQIALALGDWDDERATPLLAGLAVKDIRDPWCMQAILTSAAERSGAILTAMLPLPQSDVAGDGLEREFVQQLAGVAGARGDVTELKSMLEWIASAGQSGTWWQTATLSGLADGLSRHRGSLGRTSLQALLSKPPEGLAAPAAVVRELLEQTQTVALNKELSLPDRLSAIELLAYQPFDRTESAMRKLLATEQPSAVQHACLDAMRRSSDARVADLLLERWSTLGPTVQAAALDLLLLRAGSTQRALAAMAGGAISPSAVSLDHRVRLLRHSDESIRALAAKLFGGAVSENRREVAEQYRQALELQASPLAGVQVFRRLCAKCHRIDGQGFEVGPDISDVRNRTDEALLYDILDPNRKVEPRFGSYTVVTIDGRVFTGLMISESADVIVLKQAEGKEQVIPRGSIEEINASGKSLMPEGVEKDVTIQQMADLLSYLKAVDRAKYTRQVATEAASP